MGRYEVCTTPEPLGDDRGEALEALDAFGSAGAYRRSALARLYGGRRVRVVRSWTASGGRFESVTRLSPIPGRVVDTFVARSDGNPLDDRTVKPGSGGSDLSSAVPPCVPAA